MLRCHPNLSNAPRDATLPSFPFRRRGNSVGGRGGVRLLKITSFIGCFGASVLQGLFEGCRGVPSERRDSETTQKYPQIHKQVRNRRKNAKMLLTFYLSLQCLHYRHLRPKTVHGNATYHNVPWSHCWIDFGINYSADDGSNLRSPQLALNLSGAGIHEYFSCFLLHCIN